MSSYTLPINPVVVAAQYAVRGELVQKADKYREQIKAAKANGQSNPLPFDEIVACNIGNPHELGQRPLTFSRQVLALMHCPQLMDSADATKLFQPDAIERAKRYLQDIRGGTGAYTTSQGLACIREEVRHFLEQRDGVAANTDDIFLTDGASSGVKFLLTLIVKGKEDGVMTPIPQYPLYSASMTLLGGECAKYYLDESKGWGLTREELERSYNEGVSNGVTPRALVIINPGNPTGQCLPVSMIQEIIRFASEKKMLLMADEVYQTNVYGSTPFTSFKKVAASMKSEVVLVSFHSVSKGFVGECGQRGGFFELYNAPEEFKAQLKKLTSISLCSNVSGQLMTGLMVNPPKEGEASYPLYKQERDGILASLQRRAQKVTKILNECTGIHCNEVEGALYAFPSITLPEKAVAEAKKQGKAPDAFYCLSLLDATGICVVPGSGFGQVEGSFHFRTTILPSEETMEKVMNAFKNFHQQFMQKYA